MTKIERAENVILQMQMDGKLPREFRITSMRVGDKTKKLFVYGMTPAFSGRDVRYYEWIEFDGVMLATVFKKEDGADKYWNEEEGRIDPDTGLIEERIHELDIKLNIEYEQG